MKIGLGTVQFGLEYGVANHVGRVPLEEVRSILKQAISRGVDTIDTAIAYGESEETLGLAGLDGCKVVTKLPAIPDGCTDVCGWVETQIEGSLHRLGVPQLHGVLLHKPLQLLDTQGHQLFKTLQHLKAQGVTRKIGVSIYGPEELEILWPEFPIDLVQAPFSIVDRRIANSGWLETMKQAGTEIHVRSIFLQGALLMSSEQRHEKFNGWQSLWSKWDDWLLSNRLTPLQACLAFALSSPEIDRVIVGVDSLQHLNQILNVETDADLDFPNYLESTDSLLTNPSKWTQ